MFVAFCLSHFNFGEWTSIVIVPRLFKVTADLRKLPNICSDGVHWVLSVLNSMPLRSAPVHNSMLFPFTAISWLPNCITCLHACMHACKASSMRYLVYISNWSHGIILAVTIVLSNMWPLLEWGSITKSLFCGDLKWRGHFCTKLKYLYV